MTVEQKKKDYDSANGVKLFSIKKISIMLIQNYKKDHWIQNRKIRHNIIMSERKKMIANEQSE